MRTRRMWTLLAALLLAACGGSESSQAPPTEVVDAGGGGQDAGETAFPEGDNLIEVDSLAGPAGGLFQSLEIAGGHLYGCTASHGLYVVKLGSAGALQEAVEGATFPDGKGCREVVSAPDGALFFTGQSESQSGSWIAEVPSSEPPGAEVVVQASTLVEGLVQGIAASDTHVAVALGAGGLVLLGRQDGALTEVGRLEAGFDSALGVAFYGADRLVVANGLSGLAVVDISNPETPVIEKQMTEGSPGNARRVQIVGKLAYVAEVSSGISVVDLTTMERKGAWETHDGATSMDVAVSADGKLAYVANWEDLVVLDVSDPAKITMLGAQAITATDGGSAHAVAVREHEGVVYVADWSGLFSIAFGGPVSAPDIRLSRRQLDFGLVTLKKKGQGIVIFNLGNQPLEITKYEVSSPVFTVDLDPDDEPIAGGQEGFCTVIFEPKGDAEVKAVLTLTTNDPDEGTIEVPLSGNTVTGIQVGSKFEGSETLFYQDHATGNEVAVSKDHPNKVVILAYFATW